MIKSIHIKNVKGIQDKKFELNIYPNKPSILVAPNGFGKSSFAIAFEAITKNRNKMILEEEYYPINNSTPNFELIIEYKNKQEDKDIITYTSNNSVNNIISNIGCFVINNKLIAKGIGSSFGKATGSLEVEPIVLIDKIPDRVDLSQIYSYTNMKKMLGKNGKILENITNKLDSYYFLELIHNKSELLEKQNKNKENSELNDIISEINKIEGNGEKIIKSINDNKLLDKFRKLTYLSQFKDVLKEYIKDEDEVSLYLTTIQITWLYSNSKEKLKEYYKYKKYSEIKGNITNLLKIFDTTGREIIPKEEYKVKSTKRKDRSKHLILSFPKADTISNGQRDILTFISMLFKAEFELDKNINILIIDEVFDYLDEANLIAAQYYVTKFIDKFKSDRKIYPIILTHLNPYHFKNYIFNKQKVYYFEQPSISPNNNLIELIIKRNNNKDLEKDISMFLLHYHINQIDRREDFKNNDLKETWGKKDDFYKFLNEEKEKYINNLTYCPFAVCIALRVHIEKKVYENISDDNHKVEFLNVDKGTKAKLNKAAELGCRIPEVYYLLGVLYNDFAHLKDKSNKDFITPIVNILNNKTIRKLVEDVFNKSIDQL